jgi:hypothetical protein
MIRLASSMGCASQSVFLRSTPARASAASSAAMDTGPLIAAMKLNRRAVPLTTFPISLLQKAITPSTWTTYHMASVPRPRVNEITRMVARRPRP